MNDTDVAAKTRRVLDAQFPGQRFVVFYREGDGPHRNITDFLSSSSAKEASPLAGYAPTAAEAASAVPAAGSAEFLRVETSTGGGRDPPDGDVVSLWAVGRVSLRVEARSFDADLGEERLAAAGTAFMESWALTMQVRARRWGEVKVGGEDVALMSLRCRRPQYHRRALTFLGRDVGVTNL